MCRLPWGCSSLYPIVHPGFSQCILLEFGLLRRVDPVLNCAEAIEPGVTGDPDILFAKRQPVITSQAVYSHRCEARVVRIDGMPSRC